MLIFGKKVKRFRICVLLMFEGKLSFFNNSELYNCSLICKIETVFALASTPNFTFRIVMAK